MYSVDAIAFPRDAVHRNKLLYVGGSTLRGQNVVRSSSTNFLTPFNCFSVTTMNWNKPVVEKLFRVKIIYRP